ncbi:MAG: hypothetical protein A2Z99_06070 [Treponema sp. GWB1_62_6]|nr:MAG: hypothetical protein A2Z99_06070 [Treponema sp. GWB1_62_6]
MPFSSPLWTARQTRLGETFTWSRRALCSCHDAQTKDWNRAHSTCTGKGYLLVSQTVTGYKTVVANAGRKWELATGGRILANDFLVETFAAEAPLAEGDEITLTGGERLVRSAESLRRGVDDTAFYPIVTVYEVRRDTTLYTVVTHYSVSGNTVLWVFGQGPSTGQVYTVLYQGRPRYWIGEVLRRGTSAVPQMVHAKLMVPDEVRVGVGGV